MEVNIIASAAPSPENPLRQRVLVDGRHVLYTDEPVSVGGSDSTCSPHELLAAALAACATTMAALAAHPQGLLFNDVKELCGLTDGNLGRHLPGQTRAHQRGRNHHLRRLNGRIGCWRD